MLPVLNGKLYLATETGTHESACECCQAAKYSGVSVRLTCEDGTVRPHRVATPARCHCAACGPGLTKHPKPGNYI